ncbi:Phosphatidylinositol 3- and 4-kinase [Novymonas esmeraldas]|uniref:Phosphatidylinositol 3- and 4-kinase n=1 Tax=Novymonas esmeraldas TaxID=1808958 RepID=A0AAW0EU00_9TRYP
MPHSFDATAEAASCAHECRWCAPQDMAHIGEDASPSSLFLRRQPQGSASDVTLAASDAASSTSAVTAGGGSDVPARTVGDRLENCGLPISYSSRETVSSPFMESGDDDSGDGSRSRSGGGLDAGTPASRGVSACRTPESRLSTMDVSGTASGHGVACLQRCSGRGAVSGAAAGTCSPAQGSGSASSVVAVPCTDNAAAARGTSPLPMVEDHHARDERWRCGGSAALHKPTALVVSTQPPRLRRVRSRPHIVCSSSGGGESESGQDSHLWWLLSPRPRGVNRILLRSDASTSASSSQAHLLLHDVLAAFPLWGAAVRLELHGRSAGGTYMVRLAGPPSPSTTTTDTNDGDPASDAVVAVFKPREEEIGQRGNPHANCESDRADAFAPGSGSRREVLAYCLDHKRNAGVPPTVEVASARWSAAVAADDGDSGDAHDSGGRGAMWTTPGGGPAHPQVGSLQLFRRDCLEAADVLPGRFDVEEVHALAIFDIRTLNGDRHGGNVLVHNYQRRRNTGSSSVARRPSAAGRRRRSSASPARMDGADTPATSLSAAAAGVVDAPRLIPIDHSYICPAGYADPDYEWLSWPQSKRPFSLRHRTYIADLDAAADAELVRAALLAHSDGGATPAALLQREVGDAAAADDVLRWCGHSANSLLVSSPLQPAATAGARTAGRVSPTLTDGVVVSGGQRCGRDADGEAAHHAAAAAEADMQAAGAVSSARSGSRCTSSSPSSPCVREASSPALSASAPLWHTPAEPVTYDKDAADAAAEVMWCTTRLLQIAALEFNMTAYEVGSLCRRPRVVQASLLEEVLEEARDELTWALERDRFDDVVRQRLHHRGPSSP